MRVRMADDREDPVDDAEGEATLRYVDQAFQRISHGAFSLDWRLTPVLRLEHSINYYDTEGRNRLQADARAAAKAAGYDYEAFDLDVVRHNPIPSYAGGYGNLGQRGAWVGGDGAYIILHELGHNLGLHHANFWDTSGPSSSPKTSPPFPSNVNEGREGHEFDPDSLIGHDSVVGPGRVTEYGDIFDLMGGGGEFDQYNAAYLRFLGWLPASHVIEVATKGVYRLYDFAAPGLVAGQSRAARVARPTTASGPEQYYWLQFNPTATNNVSLINGLQLHWLGDVGGAPSTLLLDATTGSGQPQPDSALPIGHTFADVLAEIYITPLGQGGQGDERWLEVAIEFGPSPSNLPPRLELATDRLQAAPGEPVHFTATASDPNGDRLAYAWDLGDHSPGANTNVVSRLWEKEGEYLVRCEVSDLRGGCASRNLLVKVGNPETFHIAGKVMDENGQPVAGVRVHNGHTGRNPVASGYVWTRSDSSGAYTLANLQPDSYPVGAFVPGSQTERAGAYVPVVVANQHVTGVDFVSRRIPAITVRVEPPVVHEGESASFVFTRAGSLASPLTVSFLASGTALARSDYVGFFSTRVTFPAGQTTIQIPLATLADKLAETAETVTLSLIASSESQRQTVVDGLPVEFKVYYPGWELRPLGNDMVWAQTSPEFMLTAQSSATLTILDGPAPEVTLTFAVQAAGIGLLTLEGPPGAYVIQDSVDLADWAPVTTNVLTQTRLEIPVPLAPGHARRFFKATRL